MKIVLLLLSVFLMSCNEAKIEGVWRVDISLQEKILPIGIEIKREGSKLEAYLFNGGEKIRLDGEIKGSSFELEFSQSYAKLAGELKDDRLTGHWIRTNKENFKVPFIGSREKSASLYDYAKTQESKIDLSGKWKVKLKEDKYGLGLFQQEGSYITGSILTTTGDYRFLHGYLRENRAYLYGFDGVFSFVFELNIKDDAFFAQMHAGPDVIREISATRDASFELEDPNKMTTATSDKPLILKGKSLEGIEFDFSKMNDKIKIVQIFGSWCPNCIDETRFFLKWRKENKISKDVFFVAYAFETVQEKSEAIKNLKKVKAKTGMDYPIVLADYDKSKNVTDFFPIDKNRAFPTTLFLDKNNKIVKIHTGFSGQATGEVFRSFTQEFEKTITELLK